MSHDNFGRNVVLQPKVRYTPENDAEVLEILNRHQGEQIRSVGRLHSWSRVLESEGVLLDLRKMNHVRCLDESADHRVEVGAGCQIKRLLSEMSSQKNWTLPSVGFITEQTIAGAIATGTHGSGRNTLSHYVLSLRIAHYDVETGRAVIRTISAGEELLAVRCSLGCSGVILQVTMLARPAYQVEECFREYEVLSSVLAAEKKYPLQQFYFLPWRWTFFAQHRREVESTSSWTLMLYQLYRFLAFDISLHLLILFLVRLLRSPTAIRNVFRCAIPLTVIRGWGVTGPSNTQLVMEHELFRCVETEIFVRRDQLPSALEYVREVLQCLGSSHGGTSRFLSMVSQAGCDSLLQQLRGQYCHHYPICVRRVLSDETLISPACPDDSTALTSSDDWYAMTFTNYHRGKARQPFDALAEFLTVSMGRLFRARPHWGKICPDNLSETRRLYPRMQQFVKICQRIDPDGAFRNRWMSSLFEEG